MAHKMYSELAPWWHLLSPPDEYVEEAGFFRQVLKSAGLPPSPTLLELGCGGGNNALHLKEDFAQVTLTDLSSHMLEMSGLINPECEHIAGDMRTLRLGRTFDVVFVHDAIDYMLTEHNLRQALATAFVHCTPGGLALLVPDYVQETFEPSTDHGGSDDPSGDRGLRYLEWTYDPDETDSTYTVDYAYLLHEEGLPTRVVHEQHICGLYPRDVWMRLLHEVGFETEITHDEYGRDIFVARHLPER
jgi:SAM-dependent methyltransferase